MAENTKIVDRKKLDEQKGRFIKSKDGIVSFWVLDSDEKRVKEKAVDILRKRLTSHEIYNMEAYLIKGENRVVFRINCSEIKGKKVAQQISTKVPIALKKVMGYQGFCGYITRIEDLKLFVGNLTDFGFSEGLLHIEKNQVYTRATAETKNFQVFVRLNPTRIKILRDGVIGMDWARLSNWLDTYDNKDNVYLYYNPTNGKVELLKVDSKTMKEDYLTYFSEIEKTTIEESPEYWVVDGGKTCVSKSGKTKLRCRVRFKPKELYDKLIVPSSKLSLGVYPVAVSDGELKVRVGSQLESGARGRVGSAEILDDVGDIEAVYKPGFAEAVGVLSRTGDDVIMFFDDEKPVVFYQESEVLMTRINVTSYVESE